MGQGRFAVATAAISVVATLLPVAADSVAGESAASYQDEVLDDDPLGYFPLDDLVETLTRNLGSVSLSFISGSAGSVGVPGALARNIGVGAAGVNGWAFAPGSSGVERYSPTHYYDFVLIR